MKCEYKVTKQLVKSWTREFQFNGAADVILLILWLLVGLCGIGMIAILSITRGGDWLDWFLAILLLLLAVFKLFLAPHIISARRYRLMSRLYGVPEWTRTVEFTPDAILLTDHNALTAFRYENITAIRERGNSVIILCKDHLAIRLYKNSFTVGSWNECKALILAKKRK